MRAWSRCFRWTQDLFLELATHADQLDFPVIYAIARDGRRALRAGGRQHATWCRSSRRFSTHVPAPVVDDEAPFQLLVTALDYDDYKGKYAIGRITRGSVRPGMSVMRIDREGEMTRARVSLVFTYQGLGRLEVEEATAGDIVALTGIADANISETLADAEQPEALPVIEIEEPTLKMTFGVNTSPFAGREGKWSTSRQLRARLYRELETNVALRVEDGASADEFIVSGRGELHLAVLIETMRREGYELQVSRPEVITREIDGKTMEPVERLVIDTREEYIGAVSENLATRKARLANMVYDGQGNVRLEYDIPTRGLIGFRNAFLTLTKGNGARSSLLLGYEPWAGAIGTARNGALDRVGRRRRADLWAEQRAGARPDLHRAGDAGLRGHDRRAECAARRSGGERLQGEEGDERALFDLGHRRAPLASGEAQPGAVAGLHQSTTSWSR